MGRSNEKFRCGFSGNLTNAAMVRAIFFGDVFVPKRESIQVKIKLKSKAYQAAMHDILDSGATNNCIDPVIVNRFKLPQIKLKKPRPIRNIDGTKNSIGAVTHVVNLKIQYGNHEALHHFLVIHLGGDSMVLGYPFLVATNPPINWKEGIFYGHVTITTEDSHLWTSHKQQRTIDKMT